MFVKRENRKGWGRGRASKMAGPCSHTSPFERGHLDYGALLLIIAISATFLSTLFLPLDLTLNTACAAVEKSSPESFTKPLLLKRVVILPFENFTENSKAVIFVKKALKEEIRRKGLILIAGDDMVDECATDEAVEDGISEFARAFVTSGEPARARDRAADARE